MLTRIPSSVNLLIEEEILIEAYIKTYIDKHNLELSQEELANVTRSVELWMQYSIEEVIKDAVEGIRYVEVL